ncbi:carboxymuconolactone decarboxylase family protein [Arenibaculum pallidiluteum]|uniref:carboxymuconolactone decarboxylase family protein n=1 Tax=Arenibaculum pallidiluteum TaxID=2812559 RepID=UPI001A977A29|nr:carboxymuconolactone decarboxylase family protein [Arenibaculum pallidiluteum]
MSSQDDAFAAGLQVRRDMFGPAGADKQIEAATEFTRPMQDLVTRYCFGEIWDREPLDRKTRSMLTLAMLTVLNRPNQLRTHVRGAIQNGVSKEEIREVLLHAMIYAGVPAGVDSILNAQDVLKEMGLE